MAGYMSAIAHLRYTHSLTARKVFIYDPFDFLLICSVPVAFTDFDVVIEIKAKGIVPAKYLDQLIKGAELSYIVMQTLKSACNFTVSRK